MPKHKFPLCCLFAATAAFPASMTLAAPLSTTLEEVLVTAQRREESMQETPISVTAISSDTLTEIGATDVSGVSDYTPGLVITPTIGGSVNAGITIRGAGNFSNNLSRDNAVGMYLNGVPISKTSGAILMRSTLSVLRCFAAHRERSMEKTPSAALSTSSRKNPVANGADSYAQASATNGCVKPARRWTCPLRAPLVRGLANSACVARGSIASVTVSTRTKVRRVMTSTTAISGGCVSMRACCSPSVSASTMATTGSMLTKHRPCWH
ncbi:MAG: hypothetical protein CMN83_13745 [Spongiibacter sp.]|nr:hypothetical protein [Spongiibacter sp.]